MLYIQRIVTTLVNMIEKKKTLLNRTGTDYDLEIIHW